MASAELQALRSSVDDLKVHLMNFAPSPTAPYSNSDLLKCQAFVVFCHAEMQVYFDSVARRILAEAETRWKTAGSTDRVLATLLAFRRPNSASIPSDPRKPHDGGRFEWVVEEAIKAQKKVIEGNNGIKRANVAELFLPLGLLLGDLDETMLILADQTGKKRGDMVHKSSRVSLRTVRDPFLDELGDIEALLLEIKNFDTKLQALALLAP